MSSSWKPEPGVPVFKTIKLTNEDVIYKQIKSKAYESLGHFFKQKTLDFESATDKTKTAAKNLLELQASVQRIKEMNIPIEKPLIDIHSNICYAMKQNNKLLKQLLQLEMMIYHSEDPKLIIKALETKIAK